MARVPVTIVSHKKEDGALTVVPFASVVIRNPDTGLPTSIYATQFASDVLPQPGQKTNSDGILTVWANEAQIVSISVAGASERKEMLPGSTSVGGVGGGGGPERPTVKMLTEEYTVQPEDLGVSFYVPFGVQNDFTIRVPTGLGIGFHCSLFNRSNAIVNWHGVGGSLVLRAPGVTLEHTRGHASSIIANTEDTYDSVGSMVTS